MHQLILIIQIFAGIFALLGIYEFIRVSIDLYVIKKTGAKCKILICSCENDIEYAIRFAECRFNFGDHADFFDGVVLSEDIDISEDLFQRLGGEFGNISKL